MGHNWTVEQEQCINTRGGGILVSAAAGSGKTSVLVERVLRLVTHPEKPVDIDRLLVVTFTKAAAAEMKHRLSLSLSKKLYERPYDMRLQRQQLLLPNAQICTVHSFCYNLIKENFQSLGLSPDVKIVDENYQQLLMRDTLEEVLDGYYKNYDDNENFKKLSHLIGGAKNDILLNQTIIKLYGSIMANPCPHRWMEEKLGLFIDDTPLIKSVWGRVVLRRIHDEISGYCTVLKGVVRMALSDTYMFDCIKPTLDSDIELLSDVNVIIDSLKNGESEEFDWDLLHGRVSSLSAGFGRMSYPRGDNLDGELKSKISSVRDKVKRDVAKLAEYTCGMQAQFEKDKSETYPLIKTLFEIISVLTEKYKAKKNELAIIDFPDLEHYTLELLVDENGNKTEISYSVCEQFDEILVDEYQDTNGAQEALFSALSKEETNLFTVGDVKQSIYGFRNAMPSIFIERREKSPAFDEKIKRFPATITLGNNFRSRGEVTDIVNFVFGQIMRKSVGGIDYDEKEALIASASYPDTGGDYSTEFIIIDDDERDGEEHKNEIEANIIAKEIKKIVGFLDISTSGVIRKLEYGDISILLRSKKTADIVYVNQLNKSGVPAVSDSRTGFFESPEVAVVLSLFRVIDNPTLDIPLLSYLMSPLAKFTPDEMAEIRISERKLRIYSALVRYAKKGEDLLLRDKINAELNRLNKWRVLASTTQADKFIHKVYEQSLIIPIYSAMSNGTQRRANLRMFQEKARQFEKNEFKGLSSFIRYINKLISQGVDYAPAAVAGKINAVSIKSIHNSKGLEYPVVFLAGLGKQFNKMDLNMKLLMDSKLGIGIKLRDFDKLVERNTLPRLAVHQVLEKNIIAEELRVLYVALTRAREKIYLVMTAKKIENTLAKLALAVSGIEKQQQFDESLIAGVSGMGEWLLSAFLRHPDAGILRELSGVDVSILPSKQPLKIKIVSQKDEVEKQLFENAIELLGDNELKNAIKERVNYSYPYAHICEIPSKQAASAFAMKIAESAQVRHGEHVSISRPAFLSEKGLTPAERGTALHTFMQFARYSKAKDNTMEEIARLENSGFISPEQSRGIDINKVKNFFNSELYRRIERLPKHQVMREVEFFYEITAREYMTHNTELYDMQHDSDIKEQLDDSVVIQGIADCVLVEESMITIIDYKTDYVVHESELVFRYSEQLKIYAKALEFMFEQPVKECLLYSFSLDKSIKVDF